MLGIKVVKHFIPTHIYMYFRIWSLRVVIIILNKGGCKLPFCKDGEMDCLGGMDWSNTSQMLFCQCKVAHHTTQVSLPLSDTDILFKALLQPMMECLGRKGNNMVPWCKAEAVSCFMTWYNGKKNKTKKTQQHSREQGRGQRVAANHKTSWTLTPAEPHRLLQGQKKRILPDYTQFYLPKYI